MGRAAHTSNETAGFSGFAPANPASTQTRAIGRSRVCASRFSQKSSPLQEIAQRTSADPLAKSFTGISGIETSPDICEEDCSSIDDGAESHTNNPDGTGVGIIGSEIPQPVPCRSGTAKGFSSVFKLFARGARPSEPGHEFTRPLETRSNASWFRSFGNRQAPAARTPARKALVVTADSSPRYSDEDCSTLKYTARDSEIFQECLLKEYSFKREDISVIKATQNAYISEAIFLKELDRLLAEAGDGDLRVLFISMHALELYGSIYLKFFREGDGSTVLIGSQDLIDIINSKLGQVCCTVEIVLDVCYAAGLIKCQHIIRQMVYNAPKVVVSTTVEPLSVAESPLLVKAQHILDEVNASAPHINAGILQPPTKLPKHIRQNVVSGSPAPLPLLAEPAARLSPTHRRNNGLAEGALYTESLQTRSVIIIWAAAKRNQRSWEYDELQNGALTSAICQAIRENRHMSRGEIFDQHVLKTIEKGNIEVYESAKTPFELLDSFTLVSKLQHAQVLSNCNDQERILQRPMFSPVIISD